MRKSLLTIAFCLVAGMGFAQNAYTHYEVRQTHHPDDFKHYDTERIRKEFAVEKGVRSWGSELGILPL